MNYHQTKKLYVITDPELDHGEVHSVDGRYPNTREVALTAKVFQVPADTTDLILPNDYEFLKANNFIYAEGLRNTFDLVLTKTVIYLEPKIQVIEMIST